MTTTPDRKRGSYAKGQAKRQEILDAALVVFGRSGFHSGSLREIAKRVALTPAGLMHHFATKEELFTEVLRQRDERVKEAAGDVAEDTLLQQMRRVVSYNQTTPGLTSLYTVIAAEATNRDHPAHEYFAARYADRAEQTAAILADAQRDGLVREDLDVHHASRLIAAVMDGLQQQWLLDDTVDMTGVFDEFVRGYFLNPAPVTVPGPEGS
ncbi:MULTISPECIES: TetR/AcrR family transcriptional regulator [unclassified Arthrobacter]|uniref:TetR/AcrR family transcriptional regulator n=1 Tax=unclassified Arthrobacter TaxID=235627 RepID=UPI001492B62B|nr:MULTISPECIES: TetR/AcrR family transcriptional regulator [unclassified Arthrobacter]MBE0008526.1 TetR/AcrR family transcriptional regulator [Arthrobacter sp. AET 35A]NOJ59242.1 TetR/AcrR family transcriptional regulator [Arthrobacter sp. 260]NOJ62266.1 TetR/AcrR family transcriptional regulator [Arthrobacter sp. 147(2020)]